MTYVWAAVGIAAVLALFYGLSRVFGAEDPNADYTERRITGADSDIGSD